MSMENISLVLMVAGIIAAAIAGKAMGKLTSTKEFDARGIGMILGLIVGILLHILANLMFIRDRLFEIYLLLL